MLLLVQEQDIYAYMFAYFAAELQAWSWASLPATMIRIGRGSPDWWLRTSTPTKPQLQNAIWLYHACRAKRSCWTFHLWGCMAWCIRQAGGKGGVPRQAARDASGIFAERRMAFRSGPSDSLVSKENRELRSATREHTQDFCSVDGAPFIPISGSKLSHCHHCTWRSHPVWGRGRQHPSRQPEHHHAWLALPIPPPANSPG